MKSKYCFIRNPFGLCPDDFIYQVWVGSSLREFAKLRLVQEYCKDCGLFFAKWSTEIDARLDKAKSRFKAEGNPIAHPFNQASVTISDLYRMIIDDSFDSFEREHSITPSARWQLFHHTISYYLSQNKPSVTPHAYLRERKYLSLQERTQRLKAGLCVIGVIALLYLDAIVCSIFNWF